MHTRFTNSYLPVRVLRVQVQDAAIRFNMKIRILFVDESFYHLAIQPLNAVMSNEGLKVSGLVSPLFQGSCSCDPTSL